MAEVFDPLNWVPRHIRRLVLNVREKSPRTPQKEGYVYLDRNNGQLGTVGSEESFNEYPDPTAGQLKAELVELKNLPVEQIFVGNGSDEIIDLLFRAFGNPHKDHVMAFTPISERYKHFAAVSGLTFDEVPLNSSFQLPLFKTKTTIDEHTKIVVVANPNPITGTSLRAFDITEVLDTFEGIVIVDESLIDYAEVESLVNFVDNYANLVVVQSFSHAWGMAGLRLGTAYASKAIIEILEAIKAPFNVNVFTQRMAVKALHLPLHKERAVKETKQERERLRSELLSLSFITEVEASDANLLMLRSPQAAKLVKYLAEEGIYVKDVSELDGCHDSVRITVGSREDNELLMTALRQMASKTSATRRFLKSVSRTLRKASVFMGIFKKILGS